MDGLTILALVLLVLLGLLTLGIILYLLGRKIYDAVVSMLEELKKLNDQLGGGKGG